MIDPVFNFTPPPPPLSVVANLGLHFKNNLLVFCASAGTTWPFSKRASVVIVQKTLIKVLFMVKFYSYIKSTLIKCPIQCCLSWI